MSNLKTFFYSSRPDAWKLFFMISECNDDEDREWTASDDEFKMSTKEILCFAKWTATVEHRFEQVTNTSECTDWQFVADIRQNPMSFMAERRRLQN